MHHLLLSPSISSLTLPPLSHHLSFLHHFLSLTVEFLISFSCLSLSVWIGSHLSLAHHSHLPILFSYDAGFRTYFLDAVRGLGPSSSRGMFINSCFVHCQSEDQRTWLWPNSTTLAFTVRLSLSLSLCRTRIFIFLLSTRHSRSLPLSLSPLFFLFLLLYHHHHHHHHHH